MRESLLFTLLPEQQILSLFSVHSRNFEKRILASSSFKGIEWTVPEETAHACKVRTAIQDFYLGLLQLPDGLQVLRLASEA